MKKLKMNDEERKKHLDDLNKARVKKFRAKHPTKNFCVPLDRWTFDLLNAQLKKDGMSQAQFLKKAIDDYIKSKGINLTSWKDENDE